MPRPIQATIHHAALRHNIARVRAAAPDAKVWGVVKANAYGHGIARVFEAMRGGKPAAQGKTLLRLDPLAHKGPVHQLQFSGGVSEFIAGNETRKFGDLGPLL